MKKLVAILLCSLMVTPAFALLDEDTDMMGVYFDMTGDAVCGTGAFNSIVNAYVLYTNPSIANVRGFECEVTMANSAGPMAPIWFPPAFPIPGQNLGADGNMIVGYSGPIATSAATLMATISWFNLEFGQTDLFIGPAVPSSGTLPLPMVIMDDFNLMHVGTSVVDGPCASLNAVECLVVDNEDASFGAVKALFR